MASPRIQRGRQPRDALHLSFDRKVSPTGSWQESRHRWVPTTPNSFGLPAGATCPGKTAFCTSCYAAKSEEFAGVADAVADNLFILEQAKTEEAMTEALEEMISRYERHADYVGHHGGDRIFRIHWDGDFYSLDYARAWATVIRAHPTIRFWAYTRSFTEACDVVPILVGIDNLALYLSVDDENAERAAVVLARHPQLLVAACAEDYRRARLLLDDLDLVVCPENAGKVPLMTNSVGACVTCGICPDARRDIMFATSHTEDATAVNVLVRRRETRPTDRPPAAQNVCQGPDCNEVITRLPGTPGRPKKYHNETCQQRAATARRAGKL